jgi:anti-sigma B factor antagonist
MQPTDTNWQMGGSPEMAVSPEYRKELKLKLSLEMRNHGGVMIVHCQGRIVYRDEAAVLARVVGEVLQQAKHLVLDLSGVSSIDSAGMGELAQLRAQAQSRNVDLKCAGPNVLVRTLLDLTNLDTVLEVHPSVEAALAAVHEEQMDREQVCADC